MIKRFLPLIFCLSLVLPGYTGSMPGNDPVPGKGQTSSPEEPKEQVSSIKTAPKDAKGDQATGEKKGQTSSPQGPKGQVLVIRTAPKDSKEDQVTVGKNGEILIPRSTQASLAPISASVSGGPRAAETLAPKAAEESAPKAAEAGEEAKTTREKKGSKGADRCCRSHQCVRVHEK